jgi:hypothetical protein
MSLSNCTFIVDQSVLGPDNESGIFMDICGYTVTNTFIVNNRATEVAAMLIDANSGGTFSHNTVVGNATTGGAGGVSCAAGQVITNSIFSGNMQATSGAPSQIGGNCVLSYDDVDDAVVPAGTGNRNVAPVFRGPSDYHLTATSVCCVDQIPGPDPVDHDFDGDLRPINAAWDIGADELAP